MSSLWRGSRHISLFRDWISHFICAIERGILGLPKLSIYLDVPSSVRLTRVFSRSCSLIPDDFVEVRDRLSVYDASDSIDRWQALANDLDFFHIVDGSGSTNN